MPQSHSLQKPTQGARTLIVTADKHIPDGYTQAWRSGPPTPAPTLPFLPNMAPETPMHPPCGLPAVQAAHRSAVSTHKHSEDRKMGERQAAGEGQERSKKGQMAGDNAGQNRKKDATGSVSLSP